MYCYVHLGENSTDINYDYNVQLIRLVNKLEILQTKLKKNV